MKTFLSIMNSMNRSINGVTTRRITIYRVKHNNPIRLGNDKYSHTSMHQATQEWLAENGHIPKRYKKYTYGTSYTIHCI